jgi:septal ring-binding cell division protein DamX
MGFFGMIIICFLWFMVNTLFHMFQSKTPEKETVIVQNQVPMPFTIQVAAYLKQIHADRYVDSLRKRQIEADVKKTVGGGKTWFVVRVSQFPDKKSAAAYGMKLKQQGLIDDFFVNNR